MGRFVVALNLAKREHPKNVLDIGCYDGKNTKVIYKTFGCETLGIDKNEKYVKNLKNHKSLTFKQIDFEQDNIDGKFDGVFLLEVLEHFKNPYTELKKIYDLLEDNGWLVLSTPDAGNYKQVAMNLLPGRIEKTMGEKRGDGTETDHIYCWNKLTLLRLLLEVGFAFESFAYGESSLIFKVVKV